MRISRRYGSHLPVLMKAVTETKGAIVELGIGLYSTVYLHWACFPTKRTLVSYDNSQGWIDHFKDYRSDFHTICVVSDWNAVPLEKEWDVAFVDHAPDMRRGIDAIRLAKHAKYVIVHDSEAKHEHLYGYQMVYPHFKYRLDFTWTYPTTTILSNFCDVSHFAL